MVFLIAIDTSASLLCGEDFGFCKFRHFLQA
jgi:hypothetical protein